MIIIGKTIVILCNLFNYFDSKEQTTKTSDLRRVNRAKRLRIRLKAETGFKSDSVRLQWHFRLSLRLIKQIGVLNHARIGVKQVGVFILGLASGNRARD